MALAMGAVSLFAPAAQAQKAQDGDVEPVGLDPISFRGPDPRDRFKDIKIQQNLGAEVPLDLVFKNESGEDVRLGDYFDDRPVVISMVYYGCPMLCTLVLNGMVATFDGMAAGAGSNSGPYTLGKDFTAISVSINPEETPELATEKKTNYFSKLHIDGAPENWHFLTGNEENIEILSQALGFRYYYDEPSGQYAHDSGIMIVTPKGKISSYYLGIEYLPKNLRTALEVAGTDTIGEYLQQPTLLCFAYDPTKGVYGLVIMSALRLGGIATVLLIVAFWVVNYLRARRAAVREQEESPTAKPAPAG